MNSLKNTKIRFDHIEDKEEREKAIELFQEIVFACGGRWGSGSKEVKFLDSTCLYIDEDLKMSYSTCSREEMDFFEADWRKEIKMKDLTPQKNADLIVLQAKGVVFDRLGDVSGIWGFMTDRENYTPHLPSVFEEVKDEHKEREIERIESEMRSMQDKMADLADKLKELQS